GDSLVVRGNCTSAQNRLPVPAMIHLSDRIPLYEILVSIAHVLNHADKIVQNRVRVSGRAVELKLITHSGTSGGEIGSQGHVDLVENVIVEVVLVRSDSGLFEGIYAQSYDQGLRSIVVLVEECVHIRGVSRWIEDGQRGILMTGGKQRASSQGERGSHG